MVSNSSSTSRKAGWWSLPCRIAECPLSVFSQNCVVFLFNGIFFSHLFLTDRSELVVYSTYGAFRFSRFCANIVREMLFFNACYSSGYNRYFTSVWVLRQVNISHAKICEGNIKMAARVDIRDILSRHACMILGHVLRVQSLLHQRFGV